MAEFELQEAEYTENKHKTDMPFSRFMNDWLAMMKSSLMVTTYGGYQYYIEKRINPYFDAKKTTLQSITTVRK